MRKPPAITNVAVIADRTYRGNPTPPAHLSCHFEESRFHVWGYIDASATFIRTDGTLYKNPITSPGVAKSAKTIHMHATSERASAIIAAMMSEAATRGLARMAIERRDEAERAERRVRAVDMAAQETAKQAPQLLAALRDLLAIADGEKTAAVNECMAIDNARRVAEACPTPETLLARWDAEDAARDRLLGATS